MYPKIGGNHNNNKIWVMGKE